MNFIAKFFLLVFVVGFVELYLLVHAADNIGFGTTVFICILTGVIGGGLVKQQGLQTIFDIQTSISQGKMPALQIVSGLVLLVVAVMLILPGFATDILGFAMLFKPIRLLTAGFIAHKFEKHFTVNHVTMQGFDAQETSSQEQKKNVINLDPSDWEEK